MAAVVGGAVSVTEGAAATSEKAKSWAATRLPKAATTTAVLMMNEWNDDSLGRWKE